MSMIERQSQPFDELGMIEASIKSLLHDLTPELQRFFLAVSVSLQGQDDLSVVADGDDANHS